MYIKDHFQIKGERSEIVSGVLPVNKPPGISSKDVSRWLVKRVGRIKMGHVGTLDPFAEGVLPIVLGKATRLQDYLLENKKTYRCFLKLGEATDTLDKEGKIIKKMPYTGLSLNSFKKVAGEFVGQFEQVPPIYSAIKYKGRPLYDYALKNEEDLVPLHELKRLITVSSFDILAYEEGVLEFSVSVSKGTYVRSLALKLAEAVGSTGHLIKLVRLESSGISLLESKELEELERVFVAKGSLLSEVVTMDKLKLNIPVFKLRKKETIQKMMYGQKIQANRSKLEEIFSFIQCSFTAFPGNNSILVKDLNGRIFAIASLLLFEDEFILKMQRSLI